MLEIVLNASLGNFSNFSSRRKSAKFRQIAAQILARDNYTCQYCGFQAKEYQEIVNRDQDYCNNRPSNLVTACCFCSQCFFLESLGEGGYGGGILIYMPEVSQGDINSLCHVLFCAMANETSYKDSAQAIYRSLRMRSTLIDNKLGEGVSDPAVFGQLMIDYATNNDSKNLSSMLSNLRLLPSRGRFKKQIARWAASAAEEMEQQQSQQPPALQND